jgi:NAD(P)-dependent dehydrogenase (short-subunit alcohol dehydrogenase family)
MASLRGKRVLITGASSGIGAAAAEAFAREGASVAVLARSRPGLERSADRVRAHGVQAHVVAADVSDGAALRAAVDDAATALGGLDVVVINAAAMVFGRFPEVSPEDFERTMAVTFGGAVNTARAALPHLAADAGGTLVATGSMMCRVPLPAFSSYTSAKHALRGFLNTLRVELLSGRVPVRVAMVHPGPVNTPLWDHLTSRTGRLPRRPPDIYTPETVARALVAAATGGPEEVTIGGESRAMEVAYGFARPLADRVLILLDRYYGGGHRAAPARGTLRNATGDGRKRGSMRYSRPSLWAHVRARVRR